MKAVLQRVSEAEVRVDGHCVGSIRKGLVVLLGVMHGDDVASGLDLAQRVLHYRVFEDGQGKMNRSVLEEEGEVLVISQFTLSADGRKGRRPSFDAAAAPDAARDLYEGFVTAIRDHGVRTATGEFGAMMSVRLVNEGPATFLLESRA